MNTMTVAQKAYIAGIIDGEGCIYLGQRSGSRYMKPGSYRGYKGRVAVVMTSQKVIRWLHSVTGLGNVYFSKNKNKSHRDTWGWRCDVNDSVKLLNQISEFLVLKSEQCDLFLEISSIKSLSKRNKTHLPDRQNEIFNRIRLLNRRGTEISRMAPGAAQTPQEVM